MRFARIKKIHRCDLRIVSKLRYDNKVLSSILGNIATISTKNFRSRIIYLHSTYIGSYVIELLCFFLEESRFDHNDFPIYQNISGSREIDAESTF